MDRAILIGGVPSPVERRPDQPPVFFGRRRRNVYGESGVTMAINNPAYFR